MSSLSDDRIKPLNDFTPLATDAGCVMYVMQRDQRVRDNSALAAAQQQALALRLPLVVLFCLQPRTGVRAREHYKFMLAGLRKVEHDLSNKQIGFGLLIGRPSRELPRAFAQCKPTAVYFDMSPLRGPRQLHARLAKQADGVAMYEVDAHNVVPVWAASDKAEVGARTLRPRIMRQLADRLQETADISKHPYAYDGRLQRFEQAGGQIEKLLADVPANHTDISRFKPGEAAARRAVDDFITKRLRGYADARNDPTVMGQSDLNPYLHYGQLASIAVVRAVQAAAGDDGTLAPDADALIEEMVVRKELSDNFCYYTAAYDTMKGAPQWAQRTLTKHAADPRNFIYTSEQFEQAQTHDDAWNAAQRQLLATGKMHGYMRMYWAKKVLEWSASPDEALEILLYLNDRYHLDGGDPNGYVGILWSIAGLHDRPWVERPVYGQVRYMNANGLKRKFAFESYVEQHVPSKERVGLDG